MGKLSVLRVGTLNCQGLNDFYKRHAVLDYLQNSSISIFFLQETKLKPEHEIKYLIGSGMLGLVFLIL